MNNHCNLGYDFANIRPMSMIQDFKKFISRGNVIDMAVGIIIGASFTKIVDVLVGKVIMPPIGLLLGGVDFSSFKITLKAATEASPAVTIEYGLFINTLINFFIVAIAIFFLIKVVGSIYRKEESVKLLCPECKMEVPEDATRCGHCTSTLTKS